MKRSILAALMVIGCAALVQGTEATSSLERLFQQTPAPPPAPTPPGQTGEPRERLTSDAERAMTREQRIQEHQKRIEEIIKTSREQRIVNTYTPTTGTEVLKSLKPGYVLRAGENLGGRDVDHLVKQLKDDGFKPVVLESQHGAYHVLLHYSDEVGPPNVQQKAAQEALATLRKRDYQFNSVRFGPLVERITKTPDEQTSTSSRPSRREAQ